MSEPTFKDLFSGQSSYYSQARPTYPDELFQFLSSLCEHHDVAWDCATGSGQAAVPLTKYFSQVLASDASKNQLKHAVQHPKIKYFAAPAEASGLAEHSVDLVTVAQAIHWFNLERFYAEVKRVLKPGGIFCCWTYWWSDFSPEINKVMLKLADEILGKYWSQGRKLVEEKYETLYFPFQQIPAPTFQTIVRWNLEQYKTNLRSWSSSQKYFDQHGINPVDLVADELSKAWGEKELVREGKWEIYLKTARIS